MSTNDMVTLLSSDNVEIQATYKAVQQSITINTMLELLDEELTKGLPIPVPGVEGETLKKVMEWCEAHRDDPVTKPNDKPTKAVYVSHLPEWERSGYFDCDKNLLIEVANAANYLEIPLLLQYTVFLIARRLRGMSTEQMREYLNIENDFSPEEEQRIRLDNAWAMKAAHPIR